MRNLGVAAVVFLALSACSGKSADSDGDGKISSKEATAEMAAGGATAMRPGLWQIKIGVTDFVAPGVPEAAQATMKASANKGMTTQSCMTKEQVEKPGADFFGGVKEGGCEFSKLDRSGNNMTVAMTCKPGGKMVSNINMEGSFAAETYKMNMTQKIEGSPMGAVEMKGTIEGKRLGDCPQ
jgi:hypothetical protein